MVGLPHVFVPAKLDEVLICWVQILRQVKQQDTLTLDFLLAHIEKGRRIHHRGLEIVHHRSHYPISLGSTVIHVMGESWTIDLTSDEIDLERSFRPKQIPPPRRAAIFWSYLNAERAG